HRRALVAHGLGREECDQDDPLGHRVRRRSCCGGARRQPGAARGEHHGIDQLCRSRDSRKATGATQGGRPQGLPDGRSLEPQHARQRTRAERDRDRGPGAGLELQPLEARSLNDFDRAFAAMTAKRAGALLVLGDVMFSTHRNRLADLAAKSRLPAMYPARESVEAGWLMSYGPNTLELFRRAATYVD